MLYFEYCVIFCILCVLCTVITLKNDELMLLFLICGLIYESIELCVNMASIDKLFISIQKLTTDDHTLRNETPERF